MSDSAHAHMHINLVGSVFVPVSDPDRSLAFYVDLLGFEKLADFTYGDGVRWIEIAPSSDVSANGLALVSTGEGKAEPSDRALCAFGTEDIEGDHATLRAQGVEVDAVIATAGTQRQGLIALDVTISDPVPPQFSFRDPDGNRFLVVQPV